MQNHNPLLLAKTDAPCREARLADPKVMFLIRSFDRGGAERQLVTLAREFQRHGLAPVVVTFYAGGPLEADLIQAGIRLRSLDKLGRWDTAIALTRLIRMIREEQPHIIHGYLEGANLATVVLKPFFPHIRMVWGVRSSNVDSRQCNRFKRLLYKLESMLSHSADLIIANSHAGHDYAIKQGFPGAKMVVIPNGIDTARFKPDRNSGRELRRMWDVADEEILIGLVGRLHPKKDQMTFLRAAAMLLAEKPELRFVCVGDGAEEYKHKLYALSASLGLTRHMIWAGPHDNMPAVFNALDTAVSSSAFGEGFANVIGEAMACGVPCVATDVGDSAWIIGETGVVVCPGSAEDLSRGIRELAQQLGTINRDRIRKRVVEHFSVNSLCESTYKLLLERCMVSGRE